MAVGTGTGEREVYVGQQTDGGIAGVVWVYGQSGTLQATWTGADTPLGSFAGGTGGLAVDESTSAMDPAKGDVYVASSAQAGYPAADNVIDVFQPEAGGKETYVGHLEGPEPGGLFPGSGERHVAVDQANGDVVVGDRDEEELSNHEEVTHAAVYVYEPTALDSYVLVRPPLTGTPTGAFAYPALGPFVAVGGGEGDGDIYVGEETGNLEGIVYQFNDEGIYLGRTQTPGLMEGLAVDAGADPLSSSFGRLYVGEENRISVFGPDIVIPDVETGPATGSDFCRGDAVGHGEA